MNFSPMQSNIMLVCKESKVENCRSFYGCFYVGPIPSPQSLTIANALRRTLLFEISGIAIVSVEIEGASHEYCSISGIYESVLDILLNFKEVVLKSSFLLAKKQIAYLKIQGPGVVRACDIKLPSSIQCVDPHFYLAKLSDNGFLNVKLKIQRGIHYMKRHFLDMNDSIFLKKRRVGIKHLFHPNEDLNLDFNKNEIPIEATFMPINRINYNIEADELLFSQLISYNSSDFENQEMFPNVLANETLAELTTSMNFIVLEIWTNGSIYPRKALYVALKKLTRMFLKMERLHAVQSSLVSSCIRNEKKYKKIKNALKNSLKNLEQSKKIVNFEKEIITENSFFRISSLICKKETITI
nr:alpha subunit of RNA polymerase [Cylindrocapsa geminella]